jgi:hypothetical protein
MNFRVGDPSKIFAAHFRFEAAVASARRYFNRQLLKNGSASG